ncbi:unnamed protein product [Closterium sp. Naga37s-1]|nr:unnamed protein product [Closterium sp. Naga37s-1]
MVRDLPGFYYDEATNRYFRLPRPSTPAPSPSPFAAAAGGVHAAGGGGGGRGGRGGGGGRGGRGGEDGGVGRGGSGDGGRGGGGGRGRGRSGGEGDRHAYAPSLGAAERLVTLVLLLAAVQREWVDWVGKEGGAEGEGEGVWVGAFSSSHSLFLGSDVTSIRTLPWGSRAVGDSGVAAGSCAVITTLGTGGHPACVVLAGLDLLGSSGAATTGDGAAAVNGSFPSSCPSRPSQHHDSRHGGTPGPRRSSRQRLHWQVERQFELPGSVWACECSPKQGEIGVGTSLGLRLLHVETGQRTALCHSNSDVLALQVTGEVRHGEVVHGGGELWGRWDLHGETGQRTALCHSTSDVLALQVTGEVRPWEDPGEVRPWGGETLGRAAYLAGFRNGAIDTHAPLPTSISEWTQTNPLLFPPPPPLDPRVASTWLVSATAPSPPSTRVHPCPPRPSSSRTHHHGSHTPPPCTQRIRGGRGAGGEGWVQGR